MVIKGFSGCPVTSFTIYGLRGFDKKEGTPEIGVMECVVTGREHRENGSKRTKTRRAPI